MLGNGGPLELCEPNTLDTLAGLAEWLLSGNVTVNDAD